MFNYKTNWKWYLKQLFPLTYRSHYGKGEEQYFCVWKQWFNIPYKIEHIKKCVEV